MNTGDLGRYLENWKDERNSAALYQTLAELEKSPKLADIYGRMQKVEMRHAKKWEETILANGGKMPEFSTSFRTRVMIWLAKRFGAEMVLPGMQAMEQRGNSNYRQEEATGVMAAEESSHARLIHQIKGGIRGGMDGGALAQLEGRHRSSGGNALRAAVLGANDGLVSNLSLVMGVAGASLTNSSILVTGLAGLLAGACSMALGEWLSVQSSRELYTNQLRIETEEIENAPEEEAEELALIYESRGLSKENSVLLSTQLMADKNHALSTLAREELGINPEELGGSAWEAAITSFILFSIGAVVPVIPFTFLSGFTAILTSIIFSTIGLFTIGAAITLFTGKTVIYSGTRMVLFGLIAAAITFGVGKIIGTSLAG